MKRIAMRKIITVPPSALFAAPVSKCCSNTTRSREKLSHRFCSGYNPARPNGRKRIHRCASYITTTMCEPLGIAAPFQAMRTPKHTLRCGIGKASASESKRSRIIHMIHLIQDSILQTSHQACRYPNPFASARQITQSVRADVAGASHAWHAR